MNITSRNLTLCLCVCLALTLSPARTAIAADPAITHQITLPSGQTWCDDSMVNGLMTQINSFRASNSRAALNTTALAMKDAEMRASQVGIYFRTNSPATPGYDPHQGYDTTAASLGYNLVTENLAWITTNPAYIVLAVWQDTFHLAAMLSSSANVMGVSCVYDGGTPYWTYEPGICSGSACASAPPAASAPAMDSEDWAFLTLINNYRAQNGLGPLRVSQALENAALWMSNDMASKNYFGHTDSQGRSSGARLAAFGYSYFPWGENLAAGYADAQNAFDQWRTACDPDVSGVCTYAHQKNMLGAGFNAIGIARAYGAGAAYGWYWTTDFGGYVEQAVSPPGGGGTTGPSGPVITAFTATPSSVPAGSATTLSWNVTGATNLSIDQGVGNVTGTSRTLVPTATTTYTLTATNSAGSSTAHVTVTVTAPVDRQAPTSPVLTSAVAKTSAEVDLTWTASTDNVGVRGYQILRSGAVLTSLTGTTLSYADTSVSPATAYAYSVQAFDAAGNVSPASASILVSTPGAAVSVPTCPAPPAGVFIGCYYNNSTLSGSPSLVRTDSQINFDWGRNQPDRAVARGTFSARWQGNFTFDAGTYIFSAVTSDGMRLYIDGKLVMDHWVDQAATAYTVQQTLSKGVHLVAVEYFEETGWSTAHLTWQLSAPPVQPPAVLSFSATPSTVVAGQSATLSWSVNAAATVSIDNGVGDVSKVTSKTVLPGSTTTYTLTATNATGSSTARVTVTVTSAADIQPPTTPTLTSAAAKNSAEVDLAWMPSVDNVAVAGYQVLRNGTAIGSASTSARAYADMSVAPGTTYTYSVRAYDAAGNYSIASNSIQAAVPSLPAANGSCPPPAAGAFTGCYYSNTWLGGDPSFVTTDPQINFDWGGNPPNRSVGRGSFSVRWLGAFNFAQGTYTFSALTSDGMRLYIDGTLVLDHWSDQPATQYTVQRTLAQGSHVITLEYYEHSGWSAAHLTWQKN